MSKKIYEEQFAESEEGLQRFADFVAIVRQLRRDCPWDREQTHESVRHLIIEETYEAIEAIDNQDWDELKNELGDVLLHVAFHGAIAEENNHFSIQEIIESITEKLVHRHPHVFGDVEADDVDTIKQNWEALKKTEHDEEAPRSLLEGVPAHLPALLQAYRVQQKVASVGFDFDSAEQAWMKVEEELEEYREQEQHGSTKAAQEELGDVLFSVVNFARLRGLNSEMALQATNQKFQRRFNAIEQKLAEEGISLEEATLGEMNQLWLQAKKEAKEG